MALFNVSDLKFRANQGARFNESVDTTLAKRAISQDASETYDIFLSHAYADKHILLGLVLSIEDLGYKVYIDWRDDPYLDRTHVTEATANKLKARMKSCRCLLYSTTENSTNSKWMPWELGFKDGHNEKVAILPISNNSLSSSYNGQEYLGIYPYIQVARDQSNKLRLWVYEARDTYVEFSAWLSGNKPTKR